MRQEYYKYISGVMVRSYCTSLNIDGHWVSNPTEEMILADGWLPYTPSEPEPYVPQPQDEPYEYNVLEAVKTMFADVVRDMTDEQALNVAELFPTWHSKLNKDNPQQEGKYIALGERLWDDGELWKCITPHNALLNWRPKDSPSLFTTVSIAEWPAWKQPLGSTDAYPLGAQVSHIDKHWISEVDNNIWEPSVYGWREV